MKQGISLQKLAEEIIKQRERKKDYIVNTSNLRLESSCGEVLLRVIDNNGQDYRQSITKKCRQRILNC